MTTKYNELKDVQSEEVYNQLAEFTRIARYSQYNKNAGRRETWEEQVDRVFKMHKVKFYEFWDIKEFQEAFNYAKNMMLEKRCLGSQRALQFGGPAILNKEERIYNCMATYIDRPRVFQEIMYSLLCGAGMGFSVQLHHVDKLPDIEAVESKGFTSRKVDIVIEDSIEGWADAIGALLSAYFVENQPFPEYYGCNIAFNFSLIRPKGSYISHMGGKAPGPDGLKSSLEKIRKVLDNCVSKGFSKLKPIDAYDIIMHCSDAVLSGGIRRAATLALFSLEDEDMMKAKTGNWFVDNPQRGRSNNSVLLLRNNVDKEKYMKMIESVKQFGEPGMIWSDSTECLFNPCVPDNTFIQTSDGVLQVKDLINKPFTAIVDGKEYECKTGFVKTGENKQLYKIITKEGFEVRATENHKILTEDREWVELKDLDIGTVISLNNNSEVEYKFDEECGKFAKGWLMGSLYGDGTFYYPKKNAYLCYWGENRHEMSKIANKYLKQLGYIAPQSKGGHDCKNVNVGKMTIQNRELFRQAEKYINRGKILTDEIEKESPEFQAGFIRGLFDADGSVQGTQKKGVSIRLTSNNLNTLKSVEDVSTIWNLW